MSRPFQDLVDEVAVRNLKKPRVWFYRPGFIWHGLSTLSPINLSHDEYSRETIMIGWPITGRVVIAYKMCGDGDCYRQTLRWEKGELEATE